jgi:ubiquinone/menaquinone biosynthesis C-methylase UbiE
MLHGLASGAEYEAFVGRWSRLVARKFVRCLDLAPGGDWLGVGCGTGMLSHEIADIAAPRSVVGVDPSEAFIGYATRAMRSDVRFETGDAGSLTCENGSFDVLSSYSRPVGLAGAVLS